MALGALLPILVLFLSSTPAHTQRGLRVTNIEDIYAYPRFRVSFLNGFPVSNTTAERWLKDGLVGGEGEFLGEGGEVWRQPGQIEGSAEEASQPLRSRLERMILGPKQSPYLCLLPDPSPTSPTPVQTLPTHHPNPIASWQLLEPLNGKCFYLRQGWFTYSYCHNDQVRQFREMAHAHPHPPSGRTPEEDPNFEAYTLGVSPMQKAEDRDVALRANNNLELRGIGQRYLVQTWSDGTVCDKSGRSREVEVQFHCSMTTTDGILLVKETRTCQYVLVLQTPRLCSEPGFRSERDSEPVNAVRCREIVETAPSVNLGASRSEDQVPGQPGATLGVTWADKAFRMPKEKRAQLPEGKNKGSELEDVGSEGESELVDKDKEKAAKAVQRNRVMELVKSLNQLLMGDQEGLDDINIQVQEDDDGAMIILDLMDSSMDADESIGEGEPEPTEEDGKEPAKQGSKTFSDRVREAIKALASARGQRADDEWFEDDGYEYEDTLQPHVMHEDL
ncbi:hypothetical protein CALCODRAFT_492479 [Calocera cornea HHB12733]|uniref:Protein OS-9 homolog n=1 Tax=Calocera cornea HHB12733 TaxID=1353952 RepID=A0A165IDK7_9BASI|nr:hypothetical protein CALCODRAFT_492479 [Calocera cornea HHB12733]